MPTITFVTPPGRPSVLRASTVHHSASESQQHEANEAESRASTAVFRQTRSASTPAADVQPSPLVFRKRVLPQLTASPEAVKQSFDLPSSRISVDDAHLQTLQAGETQKPSLLSAVMVNVAAQPSRSSSATNLGILRRTELDDIRSSTEGVHRATGDATEGANAPHRTRLHFVEPNKELPSNATARPAQSLSTHGTHDNSASTLAPVPMSAGREPSTQAETAPRKRSLVIQEHADVVERVAERAARQANILSTPVLEQHSRASNFGRSRQLSTSSAGDETASTRSSWALRSNSRASSDGTSPTFVSEDDTDELSEFEVSKPREEATVVSIFNNATANDGARAQHPPPLAPSSRKLTFIDPAPSRRRSPPRAQPASPVRPKSDRRSPDSSPSTNNGPVNNQGGQAPPQARTESSRRVLAFASCPRPERATRLSPAHAMRKPKSKLSASPAPHKLAYPARLRGIRGSDPIRSPAPDKTASFPAELASWHEAEQDASEGSGYSEDGEDDDSDEDEDNDSDDANLSNHSDSQSTDDSLLHRSEDEASLQASEVSGSPPAPLDEPNQETVNTGADESTRIALHKVGDTSDAQPEARHPDIGRRSSTPALDRATTANAVFATQRSPPRLRQLSRSTQTSPMSGPSSRLGRKIQPKESLSHPMCFLPDAFEDSAPPTPTELESDGYEPPRANLLQGWLSEGGSAASSRRASWQQQPSPGLRAAISPGDESLAVPTTLPPFRRSRERAAPHSVTSDGEQSGRSLGGNAVFIRESARLGQSLNRNDEASSRHRAGVSPYASPPPEPLGISVPIEVRPRQPVMWRHLSNQHDHVAERPSTHVGGYRRASHSMEPRKASSAFTSPIGSYSHVSGRMTPSLHASSTERPIRPSVDKQRAVSTSSHIRSRPLVAPSTHDTVVIATSPPRDDASTHLKNQLAHSPQSHGDAHRAVSSDTTTPGWNSEGQLPSQTTSRYWTERLSSLAQAMSDELSMMGSAVLGYESKANATVSREGVALPAAVQKTDEVPHRRSLSIPLHVAVEPAASDGEAKAQPSIEPSQSVQEATPATSDTKAPRRNSIGVPMPIKKPAVFGSANVWTAESDRNPHRRARRHSRTGRDKTIDDDASSSVGDEAQPFQFAKKEVGKDGQTRLVVIHTSDRAIKPATAADWAEP